MSARRRFALALALGLLVSGSAWAGTPADGSPRCEGLSFVEDAGVRRGARCGVWWVESQPMMVAWTFGGARLSEPPEGDFTLSVQLQRMSRDARGSVEVRTPSGIVLFQNGRFGFYESEAQWAQAGWQALPGLRTTRPFALRIEQRGAQVWVFVDGELAGTHTWSSAVSRGELFVGFKSLPGHRGQLRIVDPVLEAL